MAQAAVTKIANARTRALQNAGPPASGTSGTFAGIADAGTMLWDTTNGVAFINEGTKASPYWSPVGYDQAPLWGVHADFRDQVGKAVANTDGETILVGSGLRIYGQGVVEVDSGLVIQTAGEGGVVARMTTTDEAAHTVAIGMEAGVMQPDQHSLLVIDVEVAHVTAITARALFVGFIGAAVDALDPVVTGATTTLTFAIDDLAGILMDSGLTDAAGLMTCAEKGNAAGTQDLTAIGDTGTDMAAAGTFQRLRVEVDADGTARAFADKALLGVIGGATGAGAHSASEVALDPDEEVTPVLYLEANADAVKECDVRRFAAWAYR